LTEAEELFNGTSLAILILRGGSCEQASGKEARDMEKSDNKVGKSVPQYEEFINYDDRGNPVVLRRSANLEDSKQGIEGAVVAPRFNAEGQKQAASLRPGGSLRFFAGFDEVRARLQAKLAAS